MNNTTVSPNKVRRTDVDGETPMLRQKLIGKITLSKHYVYLMASFNQTLYVGVTNNLQRRIYQHKEKVHSQSFTARYNIDRLVYFETFHNVHDALAREKQIKNWRRSKKVALIEADNPRWKDLSMEWQ